MSWGNSRGLLLLTCLEINQTLWGGASVQISFGSGGLYTVGQTLGGWGWGGSMSGPPTNGVSLKDWHAQLEFWARDAVCQASRGLWAGVQAAGSRECEGSRKERKLGKEFGGGQFQGDSREKSRNVGRC